MAQDVAQSALTPAQIRAVEALLDPANRTDEAAAAAAGVSRRSLSRWMGDPAFHAALDHATDAQIEGVARRLTSYLQHVDRLLVSIMADASYPPAVRLRAAMVLADLALRLIEGRQLRRRVEALEAALLTRQDR